MNSIATGFAATVWVVVLTAGGIANQAFAQESDRNYGREARETTPALDRDPSEPLNDLERIHHALSRFTFGVTPALIKEVQQKGLEEWFEEQLKAEHDEPSVLGKHLAKRSTLELTNQELVKQYNPPLPSLQKRLSPEELRERARLHRMRYIPRQELKDAVLLRAALSNNQLREVASDFWRNHFSIDVSKGNVRFYATTYERDVIRGEALGTFKAMLNKQARHPAMLVFLDNFISRGKPQSELERAGREAFERSRDYAVAMEAINIERMSGLNENYGRELMELHTLGVDNFYTQEDVIAVSEALTGWTIQQNPDKPIEFQFRPDMHTSSARRILRRRIPASPNDPIQEGQAVLDMLVRDQGTAEFIAYKLCRHFVNDHPDEHMIKRIARVFRRRTDLPATYLAILKDPDFFKPNNYQAKFKRPFEFVASALRVTDAEILDTDSLHRTLAAMSEPIYQCEDPTGYYDQADAWRDPGVMAPRWQFAVGLGMGWVRGVRIPDSFWAGLEPNNPLQWKEVLAKRILPAGHTKKTDEALEKVIAKYAQFNPTPEQLGRYIVGILLGSPEFQRQ